MVLLILGASDVRRLLPYSECADVMRYALAARARGQVYQPLRTMVRPPGTDSLMALMPCYLPGESPPPGREAGRAHPGRARPPGGPGYGLKAICIVPGNPALGLDTHQGGVLVSDSRTGEPLALVNASALTEVRTAAVSALATALLANPAAAHLAIIGTGVQARAHAQAIAATRPLARIGVAGRDPERARRFAAEIEPLAGVPAVGCGSAAEALAGADIVVTATNSATPVVRRGWLAAGAHVNAVGACFPEARELDTETMAGAALFVDSRESAEHEAGDFLLAEAEGAIGRDHIRAELGDVLTGAAQGRHDDREVTVFESLGLAVEDLAAAAHAYRRACERGLGTWVEF